MDNKPDYYKPLYIYELAVHEDSAWFCNGTYCALFRLDLKSYEIELETFLPSDSKDEVLQYGAIVYYNNKLIMAPLNAKNVLIYDLNTKQIDKIELDFSDFCEDQRSYLFACIHIYEDSAFLFPARYPAIVKIDLNTYEVKYINGWYQNFLNMHINPEDVIFFRISLKNDEVCILPCWQNDYILEINLKTEEYEIFSLKCKKKELADVVYDDGIYWVTLKNESRIIRYDNFHKYLSSEIVNIDMEPDLDFGYLINQGRYIYRIPFMRGKIIGKIIQIDKLSNNSICLAKLGAMNYNSKNEEQEKQKSNISCCKLVNSQEVILFSVLDEKIIKLDLKNGDLVEYKANILLKDSSILKKHLKELYWTCSNISIEQEEDTLIDWIPFICHNKNDKLLERNNQ